MLRWLRRVLSLPTLVIGAGVGGLIFELVHPTDPAHATAAFGAIGSMLTLGGTLALDRAHAEADERRRRQEHRWRSERLHRLAELHRDSDPAEAEVLEEMAKSDENDG